MGARSLENALGLAAATGARVLLVLLCSAPPLAAAFDGQLRLQDWNGDGRHDLLFTGVAGTPSHGFVRVVAMDGLVPLEAGFLPTAGGAFRVAGVGDVDGDGRDDVVFQGALASAARGVIRVDRLGPGGAMVEERLFLGDGNGAWTVHGLADLDGDGADEILAEGRPGTAASGNLRISRLGGVGAPATGFVETEGIWQLFGAHDLDGDGGAELIYVGARLPPVAGMLRIDSFAGDGISVASQRTIDVGTDRLVGAGPGMLAFVAAGEPTGDIVPSRWRWLPFDASGPGDAIDSQDLFIFSIPAGMGIGDVEADGRVDWIVTDGIGLIAFPIEAGVRAGALRIDANPLIGGGSWIAQSLADVNGDARLDGIFEFAFHQFPGTQYFTIVLLVDGSVPPSDFAWIPTAGVWQLIP